MSTVHSAVIVSDVGQGSASWGPFYYDQTSPSKSALGSCFEVQHGGEAL